MDKGITGKSWSWEMLLDERQRQEIVFDRLYAAEFAHGTDGHNARLIIAKLAELLDACYVDQVKPAAGP